MWAEGGGGMASSIQALPPPNSGLAPPAPAVRHLPLPPPPWLTPALRPPALALALPCPTQHHLSTCLHTLQPAPP